ncbi:MAG: ELWxxDGT repeat protein [Roseinatronobacter sp.]
MWVTDGSRRGTKMLRDINIGPASSNPNAAAALGDGRALFNADDGVNGRELWVTDGTRRGTRMVADLQSGTMSSDPQMFTPIGGGRALFTASLHGIGTRIWVTDGTADGTRMLSHALNPVSMTHLGDGRVLFPAYVNYAIGTQLHITDGTDEGTRIVRQIDQPGGLDFRHFRPLGDGRAVFWQVRGVTPYELWVTDGTRAGMRRVGDSGTLHINSLSEIWSLMDGRAIFTRQDHRGNEPWITDGTRSGTGLLQDINRGAAHSRARGFTVVEGMQD